MQLGGIRIPNPGPYCDTVMVAIVNHTEHLSAASIHVDVTSYFIENEQEVEECGHGVAFVLATGKDRIEKEIKLDRKLRTDNAVMVGWSTAHYGWRNLIRIQKFSR